jgi:hypothetical protein
VRAKSHAVSQVALGTLCGKQLVIVCYPLSHRSEAGVCASTGLLVLPTVQPNRPPMAELLSSTTARSSVILSCRWKIMLSALFDTLRPDLHFRTCLDKPHPRQTSDILEELSRALGRRIDGLHCRCAMKQCPKWKGKTRNTSSLKLDQRRETLDNLLEILEPASMLA